MPIDPIELLEATVKTESHESVHDVRELLVEHIDGASVHEESGCLVAQRGDPGEETHVYLNSHMDVVGPHLPFERDGELIHGRGSCDAKGSVATLAAAFSRVEPTTGAVTLVLSPDEETYSEGLYDFLALRGDDGDMAVVGEPTGLDVCNAAQGCFKYIVEIEGVSAHSGTADSGVDAVAAGARAITAIESMEQHSHDYLDSTDQTISWVEGGPIGELTAQVPDTVRFYLNRWSVPPETVEGYKSKLQSALSDLECGVKIRNPYIQNRLLEAYTVNADEPVIADLTDISTRHRPDSAVVRPFGVAAESSIFSRYMPVAVFGPGHNTDDEGPIAHSDREHVPVDQVETATDILTTFLEETV